MSVADKLNTYSHVKNREELAGQIADLFADDVPAVALAKKYKVKQPVVTWVSDSLASASKSVVIEGADVTYTKSGLATSNTNYTQIRLRPWEVTHSQEAADSVGMRSTVARELMKAMKALMTDYDKIILATNAAAAGATSSGRRSAGIQAVATTNRVAGSGTGSTSKVQLDEATVNSLLSLIWTQGGNPKALICGGYQKRVISQNFTAKTGFTFNIDAGNRTAINNINMYEGSFGTLQIIADRQCPGMRIAVIDPDYWKIGVFRDIEQHKGAKTSSSYKGWVEAEMCLNYGNQKAHGTATYLMTSTVL